MKTITVMILLISIGAQASEKYFADSKIKNVVDFKLVKDILTFCPAKSCLAATAPASEKFGSYRSSWENGENPSSGLCRHLEGKADVVYLADGSEVAVCKFSDGSQLLGWDLVRARRKLAP